MRRLPLALALVTLAAVLGAGTCSDPPPWHGLGGSWVNDSWGPGATVAIGDVAVDVDIAMTLAAATPEDRSPLPVTGTVCVLETAGLALAGSYAVDATRSTWAGSDYGGARLDLSARAGDGRRVEVAQAFMSSASPDRLGGAILTFIAADGNPTGTIRFEGFVQRGAIACP